jgi:hypothetical protein
MRTPRLSRLIAGAAATLTITAAMVQPARAVSDGRFLYARVRNGDVGAFAVGVDGSLTSLGTVTGGTSVGPSGLAAS